MYHNVHLTWAKGINHFTFNVPDVCQIRAIPYSHLCCRPDAGQVWAKRLNHSFPLNVPDVRHLKGQMCARSGPYHPVTYAAGQVWARGINHTLNKPYVSYVPAMCQGKSCWVSAQNLENGHQLCIDQDKLPQVQSGKDQKLF